MRSSAAFVAIVLALVCAARASAVLDLTTEKFDETLKANPKGVLVEFFAPWCGHCQKLAPEYDKAAELLGSKAVLAKVDCTKENDLCGKHNIQGFPTLLWFQDGLPSPCNTERSAKGISEFVSNKLGELVDEGKSKVKVLTTANFNHTLKDIDAVVEFYAPWCGHCKDLAPKFEEAAETASEILFGKVNCDLNGELCQSYKVEGYPSIQFIRNLKGSPYNGERTVQALVEFARGKSEEFKSTNVIDLGDDFDSALSLNPKILVEFYAPWCGHCKALAPEYEKAATEMKGKIPVAKVDCTAHNELCTKYNIQGYPSIKFFEDGNPSDYQGERAASSIVAFLKKKLEGPVILVTSQAQLDEIEASGVVIIGFFTNDKDGMFDTFNQVARNPTTQDLTFAAVTDELAKKNAKTLPSIKFVRGEDVGEPLWWTQPHFKLFEEWIRNHELPLVGEIGPGTFKKYVDSGKDLIAIFLDPATKKETIEQVKEVAAAQIKYNFGWSDGIQWASIVERWLGKAPESLPVVIFLSFSEDYQLGMEGAFSTAALTKFANDLASGALKHTPKSEPVPAEQLDAVFTVVGSTLEEVINQKKDVLVEFYAPWCGHCKSLAPIYESFAKAVESVDSLVIAKIDTVANDVKHVVGKNAVTGFPTILFFPADAKQMPGIVYDGERTVQGFADFLHKRASISWKNPAALDTLLKEGVTDDHSGHAHGAHDEL